MKKKKMGDEPRKKPGFDARKKYVEKLPELIDKMLMSNELNQFDTWELLLRHYFSRTYNWISESERTEIETGFVKLDTRKIILPSSNLILNHSNPNNISFNIQKILMDLQNKLILATTDLLMSSREDDSEDEFDTSEIIKS